MRDKSNPEQSIIDEINTILAKLKKNEQLFEMAENNDLIDALIYERKSLLSRHTYLMLEAKKMGVTSEFSEIN